MRCSVYFISGWTFLVCGFRLFRPSQCFIIHTGREQKRANLKISQIYSEASNEILSSQRIKSEKVLSKAYSKIMKKEKTKDWKAVQKILLDLRLAGFSPNAAILAAALVISHQADKWAETASLLVEFQEMWKQQSFVWEDIPLEHIGLILQILVKSREWSQAMEFVEDILGSKSIVGHSLIATEVIQILSHSGRLEEAKGIYGTISEPDSSVTNSFMRALVINGFPGEALNIFSMMPSHNIQQTVKSFEIAILAAEKLGNLETALGILKNMKDLELNPSISVYNTLLSVCATHGKWQKAQEILDGMKDETTVPNAVTYTRVLQSFRNAKKCDEAYKIFSQIPASLKNSLVYTAMIELYLLEESWSAALSLFEEMDHVKIKKNVQLYTALTNALVNSEQINKAKSLVTQMQMNYIQPDKEAYLAILRVYCAEGSYGLALSVFSQIKQLHKEAVKHAMPLLLRAYLNKGLLSGRILDLVEQWEQEGLAPTADSYAVCIEALTLEGQGTQALNLFWQLEAMGKEPNSACISAARSALERIGSSPEDLADFDERCKSLKLIGGL